VPERALITGANGFVGHYLRRHLADEGDEVHGTDRSSGGPDICDVESFSALVNDVAPDTVYHLAAQSDVATSWDRAQQTIRVNVEGTYSVLDACRRAGVSRVVAVTSADIYGQVESSSLPLTETCPIRPVSPYAASKAAADMICLQAWLGHGQEVIRARSFNHFGPSQSSRFVTAALAERVIAAERDEPHTVRIGNLQARRDFTDVRDVVAAYRLLAQRGAPGEVYNVCSGTDIAIADLAAALIERAAIPLSVVVDPELTRPVDLPVLRGSNQKLRAATDWAPKYSLEQSLDDIIESQRRSMDAAATHRNES
jgi:GDP-4-dehydro-6-deoxy-D-mannose reductase